MGTIINAAAIIIAGFIGILAGSRLKPRFQRILTVAMGLSVSAISVSGFVSEMLVISGSGISAKGGYALIFSLVFGAILGEGIDLDRQIERFGTWLKQKTGNAKDASFVEGFVTASLTVCIGAMAVVGGIMDGLSGDYSILLTKSILDFVIIIVLSASLGKGCMFSAIPVAMLQGSFTLLAKVIAPLMTEGAIGCLTMVGDVLILCVGINLLADGKYRIKVANLLPAIVFAVAAAFIPFLN